jgi:ABC-2 type transport system permease protein
MVLTSLLFSLGGLFNAIYARKFDDISIIPTFVLTPLTYLGGVFYSVTFLPKFWQQVSYLNPVLYLVNVFRYGFLGISDVPVITSLAVLVALVILMWMVCYRLLERGVGIRQ